MTPLLNRFIEQLLLPPGVILSGLFLLLMVLFFPKVAWPVRIRRARIVTVLLLVGSWLLMLPVTAQWLSDWLHPSAHELALTDEQLRTTTAQAIVVFGSGRYPHAPEYRGQDTLSAGGLIRTRYAAYVYRRTGLPILVTGGRPYGETVSEAAIMRTVLEEEFLVPVTWMEEESRDTRENALFSASILKQAGIGHILLIVHNRDMPRALLAFRKAAGNTIRITPAPTLFHSRKPHPFSGDVADLWQLIPNPSAVMQISSDLHEWLGMFWYRLRE
ncbi:MAG: YdcF family protein [Magnetococcales bacterium]|nr:YdcF family protein [Magnetococcales bacterium]